MKSDASPKTKLAVAQRLFERLLMLPYAEGRQRFGKNGKVYVEACCPDFMSVSNQAEYDELRREVRAYLGLGG